MAFTPIETQEQFDEMVRERVNRAKDSTRKEFEGWLSPEEVTTKFAELNAQLTNQTATTNELTDKLKALNTQIEEREKQIAQYENDSVKTKVASELGLPVNAISFLQGEDEESIRKSAETLKGLVGTTVSPMANPEPSGGDEKQSALKSMLNEMKGK